MSSKIKVFKQFITDAHPCSYLPDRQARTLFIDPEAEISPAEYQFLAEQGYRRSGRHTYKPQCDGCNACISLRIVSRDYQFSRNDKRLLKRNQDLRFSVETDIITPEYYALYASYISQRHRDGDMYPPTYNQFASFLHNALGNTLYYVFRDSQNALKAVAVVDLMNNGLSAVYTFFDSNDSQRSLGTFSILRQIQQAKTLGLDYVYLGYWVKDCPKMNYKTRFRPAQIYVKNQWLTFL